jgi:hypothetical protein
MDDSGASDDACDAVEDGSFVSDAGESSRESDAGGEDGDSGDEAPAPRKRAAPPVAPAAVAAFPGSKRSYRRHRRTQAAPDSSLLSGGWVSGGPVAAAAAGGSIVAASSGTAEPQPTAAKRPKPPARSLGVSAAALAELEAQRRYFAAVDEQELSFEDSGDHSEAAGDLAGCRGDPAARASGPAAAPGPVNALGAAPKSKRGGSSTSSASAAASVAGESEPAVQRAYAAYVLALAGLASPLPLREFKKARDFFDGMLE